MLEACARQVKRAVLELGGKDAAIVCADADVGRAIDGIAWGAFANAGQSGGSIERAIVVRDVAERFLARRRRAGRARCASATRATRRRRSARSSPASASTACASSSTRPSPRARRCTAAARSTVAGSSGAVLRPGGPDRRHAGDAARSARRCPGPVLAITVVDSEEEAIALANDSELGLGASVWTADRYKGARIARELRVGMVWMNDHLVARSAPAAAVGRRRRLGPRPRPRRDRAAHLRRAEGHHLGPAARAAPFWWFPYDATLVRTARAIARLRSARDADRERAWREGAAPALQVAAARCGPSSAADARSEPDPARARMSYALRQRRRAPRSGGDAAAPEAGAAGPRARARARTRAAAGSGTTHAAHVLGAAAQRERPRRIPGQAVLAAQIARAAAPTVTEVDEPRRSGRTASGTGGSSTMSTPSSRAAGRHARGRPRPASPAM